MRSPGIVLASAGLLALAASTLGGLIAGPASAPVPTKVYGEWHIRIKPDRGAEYAQLIQEKGLPLFKEAGGRMVGWWTTMVGDLYEHVTIWEYDSMTAFEKAGSILSKDDRFRQFVVKRDPLLNGEDNRFERLVNFSRIPTLPETAKVVVHEVHHVSLAGREIYLQQVEEALKLAEKHGFRIVGPWQTTLGDISEYTCLWLYDSLADRDMKLEALAASEDHQRLLHLLYGSCQGSVSRVLSPASFAR